MSTSSMTAAMTTAASVASRRSSKRPVKNSSVTIVSTATVRPESCVRAPADPLTAVFERLRDDRGDATQNEEQRERREPHEQRQPTRVAELRQEIPDLLEEVAGASLEAEELRQLPGDDRQGKADDEALEDGLRDVVGEEAEACEPCERGSDSGGDREGDRHLREAVAALGGELRDRRRGQRRSRRHRADDQVPGAAERGIEDERARRGIQTDDGRHAGDRRIRKRLRNEHGPHGDSRDDVAPKPMSVVRDERAEERKFHASTCRGATRSRRSRRRSASRRGSAAVSP
jgi:hypothetical protein